MVLKIFQKMEKWQKIQFCHFWIFCHFFIFWKNFKTNIYNTFFAYIIIFPKRFCPIETKNSTFHSHKKAQFSRTIVQTLHIKGGQDPPPSITKSQAFQAYFHYFTSKKWPKSPSLVTSSFHQSPGKNFQININEIQNPSLKNERFVLYYVQAGQKKGATWKKCINVCRDYKFMFAQR